MISIRACRALSPCKSRLFSLATSLQSGHNRWSKIRHDKGKADASLSKQRSSVARDLITTSKFAGPDPQTNPRLAAAIATAKKIGVPKSVIENAIARGQGVQLSGAPLENVTIEAMIPPSVAVIMECQTDSKNRTVAEMRLAVKEAGGTVTPTSHMFDRRGRIVLKKSGDVGEEEVFDQMIEAGAIDVETEDGGDIIVLTEANQTTAVANSLAGSPQIKVKSLEIFWDPKEDMMVNVSSSEALDNFIERVQENSNVQDVYTNAT